MGSVIPRVAGLGGLVGGRYVGISAPKGRGDRQTAGVSEIAQLVQNNPITTPNKGYFNDIEVLRQAFDKNRDHTYGIKLPGRAVCKMNGDGSFR